MDLILWRHAEAEDGLDDMARALTAKGHKQAARMADWLDRSLPDSCRILVSPAVRAQQTAEALGRKFRTVAEIAPDAAPEALLRAANWPDAREPVLVVGHQPTLGQAAALVISGRADPWTVRKGSIVWISERDREEGNGAFLRAVLGPDLVGKSG